MLNLYLSQLKSIPKIDPCYFAPEVIFSMNRFENGEDPTSIDREKSDLFSLGCVALFLIGKKIDPLVIQAEASTFSEEIVNFDYLTLLKYNNNRSIEYLEEWEQAINHYVRIIGRYSMHFFKELIPSSLKALICDRINKGMLFSDDIIEIKDIDNSSADPIVLTQIASQFCNFLLFVATNKMETRSILLSIDSYYSKQFNEAFESFYNYPVGGLSLKWIDGLIVGLRNIVRTLLQDHKLYNEFCVTIHNFPSYLFEHVKGFFTKIRNQKPLTQTFFTMSLIIIKIYSIEDWIFVFSQPNYSKKRFISFNSQVYLKEGFMMLLEKQFIVDSLSYFNSTASSTLELIEKLLQRTVLTETSPNYSGLTTYNLIIFLNANLQQMASINHSDLH